MAVSNEQVPNLAPSYANIIDQLQQRSKLELANPQLTGTAADVINQETKRENDLGLLNYKAMLEDQLKSREQDRAFVNSGGIEVTPQLRSDFEKSAGFNPGTIPSSLDGKRFKDAKEMQAFFTEPTYRKNMQDSFNELANEYDAEGTPEAKKYANFLRGASNLPPDKLSEVFNQVQKHITENTKAQKPVPYADPSSSTGFRWSQPDTNGKYIKTTDDLEAPAGAGGGKPSKPIPQSELKSAIDRNTLASDIQSVVDTYSPDKVGFFDSHKIAAEQKTGIGANKTKATFQSKVAGLRNTILNLRNGQRITQSEADRLLQEIPNPSSSEKDFVPRLTNLVAALNDIQDQYNKSFVDSGYKGIPAIKKISLPDGFDVNYSPSKTKKYSSAQDVGSDYKAGKIDEATARKILADQFGIK